MEVEHQLWLQQVRLLSRHAMLYGRMSNPQGVCVSEEMERAQDKRLELLPGLLGKVFG